MNATAARNHVANLNPSARNILLQIALRDGSNPKIVKTADEANASSAMGAVVEMETTVGPRWTVVRDYEVAVACLAAMPHPVILRIAGRADSAERIAREDAKTAAVVAKYAPTATERAIMQEEAGEDDMPRSSRRRATDPMHH